MDEFTCIFDRKHHTSGPLLPSLLPQPILKKKKKNPKIFLLAGDLSSSRIKTRPHVS
jgi:hypothetical protein